MPVGLGLALGGFAANQLGSFLSARRTRKKSDTLRRRQNRVADQMENPYLNQFVEQTRGRNPFEESSMMLKSQMSGTLAAQRQNVGQMTAGMTGRRAGAIQAVNERSNMRTLGQAIQGTTLGMMQQRDQTLGSLIGMQNQIKAGQAQIRAGGNLSAFQAQIEADPFTSLQETGAMVQGMGMDMMGADMRLTAMGYDGLSGYGQSMRDLQGAQMNYLNRSIPYTEG